MKAKFILLGVSTLAMANMAYASQAQYGNTPASSSAQYGNSTQSTAHYGPSSSAQYGNANSSSGAHYGNSNSTAHYGNDDEGTDAPRVTISSPAGSFVFSENGPSFEPKHRRHHRRIGLAWIDMYHGEPLPGNAVVGGMENGQPLFVCHGNYANGVHPGKVVSGACNIGYAGKEVRLEEYQVLTSVTPLGWAPASNGYVPPNAIAGGYEPGRELMICQARYNGGIHPGKIVGRNCNFGWGGNEVSVPFYKVLVS